MSDGHIRITIDDNVGEVTQNLEGLEKDIRDLGSLEVEIRVKTEEIEKATARLEKLKSSLQEKEELKFVLDDFLNDINTGQVSVAQLRDTLGSLSEADLDMMGKKMAEGFRKAREELVAIEGFAKESGMTLESYLGSVVGQSSFQGLVRELGSLDTTHLAQGLEQGAVSAQKMEDALNRAVISKEKLVKKSGQLKQKTKEAQLEMLNIGKNIDLSNNALAKGIKTLGRYGMSLIGIRSVYLGLQRVANAWLNSGQEGTAQLQSDLQSMMTALGSGLAPVIRWIVDHLALALGYVNELLKAFFGISLNASNTSKSIKSGVSGAKAMNKELKKQLAGFDEMNQLQDTSASSGGGGVGGSTPEVKPFEIPAPDITKLKEGIEKAIEVLKKLWPVIKTIGVLFGAWKLFSLVQNFGKLIGFAGKGAGAFSKIAGGISLVVGGLAILLVSTGDLILNWENLSTGGKILRGVLAVVGAGLIALGLILLGVAPHIALIVGAIALLVAGIGFLIYKLASEEEAILSVEEASNRLKEAQEGLVEANDNYINSVDRAEEAHKRLEEAEKAVGMTGAELFSQVENGTLTYESMNSEQRELYKAYIDNEKKQQELKESTEALTEAKKLEKKASWDNELAVHAEAGSYDEFKKKVIEAMEQGELSTEEARDLMGKAMSGMSRDAQKTFMEDMPSSIKDGLDPKNYETTKQKISKWFGEVWKGIKEVFSEVGSWFSKTFSGAWESVLKVFSKGGKIFEGIKEGISSTFKVVVNKIIDGLNQVVKVPFDGLNNALRRLRNISVAGLSPFSWLPTVRVPQIPKLAKGGIVVRPTQAVIGEAGREAIIPLDRNTEWLDMLVDRLGGSGNQPIHLTVQVGEEIIVIYFYHILIHKTPPL